MRFRRLTKNELEHLEEDFVRFLASNQITADEWEKFKTEQPQKVHELLDIFSDIVLENCQLSQGFIFKFGQGRLIGRADKGAQV